MESFLKGRLLYKKDNGKKFYAIKIPFGNKKDGVVSYQNYFILRKKDKKTGIKKLTYELINTKGEKFPIKQIDDDGKIFVLTLKEGLQALMSFENKKILFSFNDKDESLIGINSNTNKVKFFVYYPNGNKKQVVEYSNFRNIVPTIKKQMNIENGKNVIRQVDFMKNGKLRISSIFNDNREYRKEYRKDGTLKYLSEYEIKDMKDFNKNILLSTSIYLQSIEEPVIVTKDNQIVFKDPKTKENSIIYLSKDNTKIIKIFPNDKEKCKKTINNIFQYFLNSIDFLNDTMTQELANAYIYANLDKSKTFLNFDMDNQIRTLKELQKKYFKDDDYSEFKVGIITNKAQNHSLCIVIPNPKLYPNEKAILIDSSFAKTVKVKNGIYNDVDKKLVKNIQMVNSKNIQHGNSCVLFSLGITELLSKKESFFDIKKSFVDYEICNYFSIPTKFEQEIAEKIPQMFQIKNQIKDKHGEGLVNRYFINDLKQRVILEEKYRKKLLDVEQKKLEELKQKFNQYNIQKNSKKDKFYFRNKIKQNSKGILTQNL